MQVAKLAGVPDAVINRAKEIARELEEHDLTSGAKDIMPYGEAQQLSSSEKAMNQRWNIHLWQN